MIQQSINCSSQIIAMSQEGMPAALIGVFLIACNIDYQE